MMKIWLEGRYLEDIKPLLEKNGFSFSEESPDIIITHGGDGALLGAERTFPGTPKFPIRDRRTAPLCPRHGKSIPAINDIFIHNRRHVSAIRYRVWIDNEMYADEIVGDGVGVSTVHGSTAYYRSITHSFFRVGIGLAFSNSTELTNHIVLNEGAEIEVEITRGPAVLNADNSPENIELTDGDRVIIKKIPRKAEIYGLDIFMCPECRIRRHPKSRPFLISPGGTESEK
jgi:NAD+ kinase